MLEKSKSGIYSQFEVQRGLPIQLLVKHFTQIGELWQISPDIRVMVQHRQLNLLQDFSHLGKFDVIFCRNVLIYFDQGTKVAIFERLARQLEGDGVLLLGAANPSSAFPMSPALSGPPRPLSAEPRPRVARHCGRHAARFEGGCSALTRAGRLPAPRSPGEVGLQGNRGEGGCSWRTCWESVPHFNPLPARTRRSGAPALRRT